MSTKPGWSERHVTLPARGEIFVRESTGPSGAPTLVLLHGLGATGLLNWRPSLSALGRAYRVVVVDHRGHGRGIRIRSPFRLADCADDVAALADELEIERMVAVGYSMGGPIAQLLWRRHPSRVSGLVLCATACRFSSRERRRLLFAAKPFMNAIGHLAPREWIQRRAQDWVSEAIVDPAIRDRVLPEVRGSDPISIGQAAAAIGRFDSRDWIGGVSVPTSVVVTGLDDLVRPEAQRTLAGRIPGARIFEIPGDHSVCVNRPDLFVPTLERACASVAERAAQQTSRIRNAL